MGLFTTPLVINDGTDDRTFDWLRQIPGEIGGLYTEPAATASAVSRLKTGHSTQKNGRERHLLQRSEQVALTNPGDNDPALDPIVVNITVQHHPKHALADVEKQVIIAIGAASETGFTAASMRGEI